MFNRSIMLGLCGLVLLSCVVSAQGAQKFQDYPVRQPRDYSISARQDEVSIGIEPVESDQDQLTYFHTSLSHNGFLPVLIVVHNQSKSDSLLLDKGAISYGLGNSPNASPKENTAGQKAGIASAGFFPFIGPFLSAAMTQDNSEVKQNLVLRELQSGTLSPGDTVHGFLYIPIPKSGPIPKIHIQFPVAWAGSDKTSILHLDF